MAMTRTLLTAALSVLILSPAIAWDSTGSTVRLDPPVRGIPDAIRQVFPASDRALPRTLVTLPDRGTGRDRSSSQALAGVRITGCGAGELWAGSEILAPVEGLFFSATVGTDLPPNAACRPQSLRIWLWVRGAPESALGGSDQLWELRFNRRGQAFLRSAGGMPEAMALWSQARGAPLSGRRTGRPVLEEWAFHGRRDTFPARLAFSLEEKSGAGGHLSYRPTRLIAEGCLGPPLNLGPSEFSALTGTFAGFNLLAYAGQNGVCDFRRMVVYSYQTVPGASAEEGVPTVVWQARSDLDGVARLYGPDPDTPSLSEVAAGTARWRGLPVTPSSTSE